MERNGQLVLEIPNHQSKKVEAGDCPAVFVEEIAKRHLLNPNIIDPPENHHLDQKDHHEWSHKIASPEVHHGSLTFQVCAYFAHTHISDSLRRERKSDADATLVTRKHPRRRRGSRAAREPNGRKKATGRLKQIFCAQFIKEFLRGPVLC